MPIDNYPSWNDYVCPPADAKSCEGELYIFASGPEDARKPVGAKLGKDATRRQFEKNNKPHLYRSHEMECQANGLSCFKKESDALEFRKVIPSARKWPLALVRVHSGQGVAKNTPGSHPRHWTWWPQPYRLIPDGVIILGPETHTNKGGACDANRRD